MHAYGLSFPGGASGKEPTCQCMRCKRRGSGRSPGGGNGNQLLYSCLENPMGRGAWQATVHGFTRVGHNLVTKPPPPTLLLKERERKNTKVDQKEA